MCSLKPNNPPGKPEGLSAECVGFCTLFVASSDSGSIVLRARIAAPIPPACPVDG